MKILVTYQSKTGFTEKYAKWIAEDLSAELKEVSSVKAAEIAQYDVIIHGGWIMGGMLNGLEKIRAYHPAKLIVFGVGFTAQGDADVEKLKEANKLSDIPFFYYEGGMDPKKMGFAGRTMVKMVTKKTPEYADNTNKEAVKELEAFVKTL